MIASTILSRIPGNTMPPTYIVDYEFDGVGAGAVSTELVELKLYGPNLRASYRLEPCDQITEPIYGIKPVCIRVSSDSDNLTVKFLEIDDITMVNTIREALYIEDINLLKIVADPGNIQMINRDEIQTNSLYLYLDNTGGGATGTVSMQITYERL